MTTFETHLTAVMDGLIRASVCEITKLFQETVSDYLVELSLNRKENDALKLRLRLTENKLRTERMYGAGWAASRRNAGSVAEDGLRHKRKVEKERKWTGLFCTGGHLIVAVRLLLFTFQKLGCYCIRLTPRHTCFFFCKPSGKSSSLPPFSSSSTSCYFCVL